MNLSNIGLKTAYNLLSLSTALSTKSSSFGYLAVERSLAVLSSFSTIEKLKSSCWLEPHLSLFAKEATMGRRGPGWKMDRLTSFSRRKCCLSYLSKSNHPILYA